MLPFALLSLLALSCERGDAPPATDDSQPADSDTDTDSDTDGPSLPEEPQAKVFEPDSVVNQWVLRRSDAPNDAWEAGIAYDSREHRVVRQGGHIHGHTAQSSYAWLYDLRDNTFTRPASKARPQRRCITQVAYSQSTGQTLSMSGIVNHGSVDVGVPSRDGTRIDAGYTPTNWRISTPQGPWLYDSDEDIWLDARVDDLPWGPNDQGKMWYGPLAYSSASDAVFGLAIDKLAVYLPGENRVVYRELPEELHNRLGYGIASLPESRKLVVFGGLTTMDAWTWYSLRKSVMETLYAEQASSDTWVYDVVADSWHQVETASHPPDGAEMDDSLVLAMVGHPGYNAAVLVQSPVSGMSDRADWGAVETWVFDGEAETWTLQPTLDAPPFRGMLTYAAGEDNLVMWGGGADSPYQDNWGVRPAGSTHLYSMRLELESPPEPAPPEGLTLRVEEQGVVLAWTAYADITYTVLRAPIVDGVPGEYEALAQIQDEGWVDLDPLPGHAAYRIGRTDRGRASLAVRTLPPRPLDTLVNVSDGSVSVTWRGQAPGYLLERRSAAEGSEWESVVTQDGSLDGGWEQHSYLDTVDTSGAGIEYRVVALDAAGEPAAYGDVMRTFTEAPQSFNVVLEGGQVTASWEWDDSKVGVLGFDVFYTERWDNYGGEARTYWQESFQKMNSAPVQGNSFVFSVPAGDLDHLVYVRAINALGQPGLYTDLASPTKGPWSPAATPLILPPE